MPRNQDERSPLLHRNDSDQSEDGEIQKLEFEKDDSDNPKQWPYRTKMINVAVIAAMAILSPLASAMFTPGIAQIADDLKATEDQVIGATTGFVVMLGIGPLILAPLSETVGRRMMYLICFSVFSLAQIPTALAPNVATMVAFRTVAGFFGSVGIANGGGTISDMFEPRERAGVFGWYLLGPLLGPTIGPLFGGIIVEHLSWRWIFWVLTIVSCTNTLLGFVFLRETYAPTILQKRCEQKAKEDGKAYTFEGEDRRPLSKKMLSSVQRPLRILFTQPIVATMALYQAIIFATMYTLYTNLQDIYSEPPYNFNSTKVGLLYLGPGLGFLVAVWFLVPRIDQVFNYLTKKNNGEEKPEYRLPLANIGALLLPISMFWFAWTVEYRVHWFASISSTFFFGFGQVAIFNTTQNYYIDAFSKYAASAIAAGAAFRSIVGGIVPLFAPALFDSLGYGWGWSFYGFLTLALAPSPWLFYTFGERLRKKFEVEL